MTLAHDLVFEIGTEEIPARFMSPALKQMANVADKLLKEYRLPYEKVTTYGTPRRLTIYITGLAEEQEEIVEEIKGPPKKIAFTPEGEPTKAALGFAKNQGVKVENLVIREHGGGEYVFALKREAGHPATEVLPDLLTSLVNNLNFPKPMRWGSYNMRFARPIRWILSLFGNEVISLELAGLKSSDNTYGHRFLSPGPHKVPSAREYFQVLEENYVIVDQNYRRRLIWEQITSLASKEGGKVKEDPDLLEEITYLLEYPTALTGRFNSDYLRLPTEVVITPMVDHQRYFPVWDEQDNLMPIFITVHNGTKDFVENISRGNEKVLEARLADAAFFYREDQKTSLASKIQKLDKIIFQESLGTVLDKSKRLQRLGTYLVHALDLPAKLVKSVERTAQLAKADLVTLMVYEFPELQGIMGSYYAANDGEEELVCEGINQHYWPRFAGDRLPNSLTGMVVGLADRFDTLVGCFGAGLIPTGSQDPYALRRQAIGVVSMAVEFDLKFSLSQVIRHAYEGYTSSGITLKQPLVDVEEQLIRFYRQRLEYILNEKGISFDVIQAVLEAGSDDLASAYRRAKDLNSFKKEEGFEALQTAFTRAFNLARQAEENYELEPNNLKEKVEIDLFKALEQVKEKAEPLLEAGNYLGALKEFTTLQKPIDSFFDGVMVMVPDINVRNNRLALLQKVVELVFKVADFSRLVS
ncbi:MAG: glycyl-tRNA synthetase beta chain [Clostridia bacterium]|nr:glycyl-tRNA synthetase beta chain [Clostridia bacterium]